MVFGTAADGDRLLYDADLKGPAAIVIGSEGTAWAALWPRPATSRCAYPCGEAQLSQRLRGGAILLYEAVRQRMQ